MTSATCEIVERASRKELNRGKEGTLLDLVHLFQVCLSGVHIILLRCFSFRPKLVMGPAVF